MHVCESSVTALLMPGLDGAVTRWQLSDQSIVHRSSAPRKRVNISLCNKVSFFLRHVTSLRSRFRCCRQSSGRDRAAGQHETDRPRGRAAAPAQKQGDTFVSDRLTLHRRRHVEDGALFISHVTPRRAGPTPAFYTAHPAPDTSEVWFIFMLH